MLETASAHDDGSPDAVAMRKRLGSWYTPSDLVDLVVEAVCTPDFVGQRSGRPIRVLDPACGDGRFLAAAARRIDALGATACLVGIDIDADAVAATCDALPAASVVHADALTRSWSEDPFDLVLGNPPFLSQLARATTRRGAGARGAGTYGDAAVEFLALAGEVVDPDGGRVAMVLPQSVLSSRDASVVRRSIDRRATLIWSWWSPEQVFDAQVLTCVVAFEFGGAGGGAGVRADAGSTADGRAEGDWTSVVTARAGVPAMPSLVSAGTLGERATLNANFRDQYYALVGAVAEDVDGPPLITSGLIDPGCCHWDVHPITFARRRIRRPRVAVDRLDATMQQWAARRLVPKVLVANQTSIIEAVADADGVVLPGVPVVAVYPRGAHWDDDVTGDADALRSAVAEIAAVLTSPVASAWLWHQSAGTGLAATSVRASPTVLAALPWPGGDLGGAVSALADGDVRGCGRAVDRAFGVDDAAGAELMEWWEARLQRVEARAARQSAATRQPG